MIAKLIAWGRTREEAMSRMRRALSEFRVGGIRTTIAFHQAVLDHPDFRENRVAARWVEESFMKQLEASRQGAGTPTQPSERMHG